MKLNRMAATVSAGIVVSAALVIAILTGTPVTQNEVPTNPTTDPKAVVQTIPSPPNAKVATPQKSEPQQNWAPVEEDEPGDIGNGSPDDKVIVSPNAENPTIADVKPAPNQPTFKPRPTSSPTP
jgi:hypothetical protein